MKAPDPEVERENLAIINGIVAAATAGQERWRVIVDHVDAAGLVASVVVAGAVLPASTGGLPIRTGDIVEVDRPRGVGGALRVVSIVQRAMVDVPAPIDGDADKRLTVLPDLTLAWAEASGGGGEHPDLPTHDAMGLATDVELEAHADDPDAHGTFAASGHTHSYTSPVVNVYTSTAGGTWTKPGGLKYIVVEVMGGGGGGGGAATNASGNSSGAGGGAGGYARKLFLASALPASCAWDVGAGGAGGSAGANDGSTGGASTFSGSGITTVQGNGGTGGTGGASSTGNTRNSPGSGGSSSGGDINMDGSDGGGGIVAGGVHFLGGFGGGGILGTSQRGANGTDGAAGQSHGGGGAGGSSSGANARAGGAGADGVVIVTEFYV